MISAGIFKSFITFYSFQHPASFSFQCLELCFDFLNLKKKNFIIFLRVFGSFFFSSFNSLVYLTLVNVFCIFLSTLLGCKFVKIRLLSVTSETG